MKLFGYFRYERVMGRPSWAEKLLNKKPDEGKRFSLFLNQR
jgi:hypothetical protein